VRFVKLVALAFCKALGIFAVARWLTRRHLNILCYHGFELVDEANFLPKLFIRLQTFERRLETIERLGFGVVSLDEAVEQLYSGTLPERSLVITVDDGFHSFHRLAVPALRRRRVPATVYVTTYYVQHGNPVFRLFVQYLFWKTQERELRLDDAPWSTERLVDLSDAAQAKSVMWNCIEYGERHCSEEERCALSKELASMLRVPYEETLRSRILHLMNPDELRSLKDNNVTVELHTHRHAFSRNDQRDANREIQDNRDALRMWVAGEKRHFCYPSGLWAECQWAWLDAMGIRSSTTCVPGANDQCTPRHALRRILDSEHLHQLEFEAALSGLPGLLRRANARLARAPD
jgi:peptidoglycan/xylan/chitin deacetylase (PgdA/CDA1 family)